MRSSDRGELVFGKCKDFFISIASKFREVFSRGDEKREASYANTGPCKLCDKDRPRKPNRVRLERRRLPLIRKRARQGKAKATTRGCDVSWNSDSVWASAHPLSYSTQHPVSSPLHSFLSRARLCHSLITNSCCGLSAALFCSISYLSSPSIQRTQLIPGFLGRQQFSS